MAGLWQTRRVRSTTSGLNRLGSLGSLGSPAALLRVGPHTFGDLLFVKAQAFPHLPLRGGLISKVPGRCEGAAPAIFSAMGPVRFEAAAGRSSWTEVSFWGLENSKV